MSCYVKLNAFCKLVYKTFFFFFNAVNGYNYFFYFDAFNLYPLEIFILHGTIFSTK